MKTAEQLIEFCSKPVRQIFEATGYIRPMMHFIDADGKEQIVICPAMLSKLDWAVFSRAALEFHHAVICILINEAWMLRPENITCREEIDKLIEAGIRNSPNRVECIAFFGEDANGEVAAMMPILRDRKEPYLGDLEIMPRANVSEGNMVGMLPIPDRSTVN